MSLLLTVPFAAAQTVAAWMSVIIPGHGWETEKQVATYFLAPYVVGTQQQCDRSNGQRCGLQISSCVGTIPQDAKFGSRGRVEFGFELDAAIC